MNQNWSWKNTFPYVISVFIILVSLAMLIDMFMFMPARYKEERHAETKSDSQRMEKTQKFAKDLGCSQRQHVWIRDGSIPIPEISMVFECNNLIVFRWDMEFLAIRANEDMWKSAIDLLRKK